MAPCIAGIFRRRNFFCDSTHDNSSFFFSKNTEEPGLMACGGTCREGMASSGSGPRGPENRRKKRLGTGHRRKETLFPMDEVASMARARDRREWGKDRLSLLCREGEKYFQKKLFCRIRFLPHNHIKEMHFGKKKLSGLVTYISSLQSRMRCRSSTSARDRHPGKHSAEYALSSRIRQ